MIFAPTLGKILPKFGFKKFFFLRNPVLWPPNFGVFPHALIHKFLHLWYIPQILRGLVDGIGLKEHMDSEWPCNNRKPFNIYKLLFCDTRLDCTSYNFCIKKHQKISNLKMKNCNMLSALPVKSQILLVPFINIQTILG